MITELVRRILRTDTESFTHHSGPKPWRYALDSPVVISSEYLNNVVYLNEWVTIENGSIRISEGYAWDGCSPCISVLGLFYLGPPDGSLYLSKPRTYYASLVHDIMCQWRDEIPISKSNVLGLFKELLVASRFPLASVYTAAVSKLGPQKFLGN